MLEGVNDSLENAKSLSELLNFWFERESAKVNLIPFNPFPESQYKTSKNTTIDKFQDILHRSGIRTTTRRTRGDDVDAACGQLAGKVLDKSRRNVGRNCLLPEEEKANIWKINLVISIFIVFNWGLVLSPRPRL